MRFVVKRFLTLAVFGILAAGIIAGCSLLRPMSNAQHPPTHLATAQPSESPSTPAPTPTETTSATASPTPARAVQSSGAKLALIIDDCGQWDTIEQGFIALPVPLTLSVLPDVHGTKTIAQAAADAGKGVMLHLPMETVSGMNPGPGKVTTEMSDAQIARQVNDDLAQVPLAKGVNNHEGSKASADTRVMRDVVDVIAKHGDLFFVDSKTSPTSVAAQAAAAAGVPNASRDVFLDNKEDVAYSESQLLAAAAIAKRTGSAIAIGHPRATTLAAVRELIPKLQADGIEFVLVQSLTR